jgi:hypothetical protein
MKKIMISVLLILFLCCSAGCNWFIPGAIKRQTSLINIDVKTCLKEIKNIKANQSLNDDEKDDKIKNKALRTLIRIKPQVENIDNYTHGRPASPSITEEIE